MEFTELEHLTHEIGTAILVLLYILRLIVLFRRRLAKDLASNPKGDILRGVADAFVTIVMPWKMESTRKHWMRYVEFVVFHIGVFINIVISFVIAYAPRVLTAPVRSVVLVFLAASLVAGGARLYRRANRPDMRVISSPDDYIAMAMVLLFLSTGILALVGWQPGIVAYFVIAAFFLVYEPFSKIRHYIYYPFARYFYGAAFGKRGVLHMSRPAQSNDTDLPRAA
jgi:nitrate reductase gamma subunit